MGARAPPLVIVESFAKTKTISKYLGGKYDVVASMGHIRDLDPKTLSIDIENDFEPQYTVMPTKTDLVKKLKQRVKEASALWLATDCDREGEAIAMHLKSVLKPKCKVYRVVFSEITPRALEHAFANPMPDIDHNLVEAQETRRILDRLVGYKISPILWKAFPDIRGLSAGRVQSAALGIVSKREDEIKAFGPGAHHWKVQGKFDIDGEKVLCTWPNVFESSSDVKRFLKALTLEWVLASCNIADKTVAPPEPFKTSTLQQTAFTKLRMSAKRTIEVAQKLYEGGHITYMRTDSVNISKDFVGDAHAFITDTYGKEYVGKGSVKNSTGAHEAIRPTRIKEDGAGLEDAERKLYKLIWERTAMSLMSPQKCKVATYVGQPAPHPPSNHAKVEQAASHPPHKADKDHPKQLSNSTGGVGQATLICFAGFAIIEGVVASLKSFRNIPVGTVILCDRIEAKDIWEEPPGRYTEASLIKTLEKEGIGRPSTYTSIIGKLLERDYVVVENVKGISVEAVDYIRDKEKEGLLSAKRTIALGSEKNKFILTDVGAKVFKFVASKFPYITDSKFTAGMEQDLDKIAAGQKTRLGTIKLFWDVFSKDLGGDRTIRGKDGTIYILRNARYGPVAQWTENGVVKYVGLPHDNFGVITLQEIEKLISRKNGYNRQS